MLSDLLKINFAKDKPVSTNLDGNMFVDVDTHKNKMIKSNGLDDLNVKMNITKIKPADGKITGCSDMDQLKTTGSYKAKFESNPYAFMGLNPELPNIKIPAPYFWRVNNDKELMISRMQNEAGFDNPFRAKLNNYQSDGIIDIPGNINPNDVKVQGREQSFKNFLATLNNQIHIDKDPSEWEEYDKNINYAQSDNVEEIKQNHKIKGVKSNPNPLRVQSVNFDDNIDVDDDDLKVLKVELENIKKMGKKRPTMDDINEQKNLERLINKTEKVKAKAAKSLLLPNNVDRSAKEFNDDEHVNVKERTNNIEKVLQADMFNSIYENIMKNYAVKDYIDNNETAFDRNNPSSEQNLQLITKLIQEGKITRKAIDSADDFNDKIKSIKENYSLGNYLRNVAKFTYSEGGRSKTINLKSMDKLNSAQRKQILDAFDSEQIPPKKDAGRKTISIAERQIKVDTDDDEED
jgi:hypothetical protein